MVKRPTSIKTKTWIWILVLQFNHVLEQVSMVLKMWWDTSRNLPENKKKKGLEVYVVKEKETKALGKWSG